MVRREAIIGYRKMEKTVQLKLKDRGEAEKAGKKILRERDLHTSRIYHELGKQKNHSSLLATLCLQAHKKAHTSDIPSLWHMSMLLITTAQLVFFYCL